MGRRPGSKNRPKTTTHEVTNVSPVSDPPSPQATIPEGAQVADGGAEEEAEKVEATPEYNIKPDDSGALTDEDLLKVSDESNAVVRKRDNEEADFAIIKQSHTAKIKALNNAISALAEKYLRGSTFEEIDTVEGVARRVHRRTGEIVSVRSLATKDVQAELPVDLSGKKGPTLEVGKSFFWSGSNLTGTIAASDDLGFLVEYADSKDVDGNPVENEPAKLVAADFDGAVSVDLPAKEDAPAKEEDIF